MSNVVKLDMPYRTILDLAGETGVAVLPKSGDRLTGQMHIDEAGGDIVLRYADGSAVTLANL